MNETTAAESTVIRFDVSRAKKSSSLSEEEDDYKVVIHPCFEGVDSHICFKWTLLHRGFLDFKIQCDDCATSFKLQEFLDIFGETPPKKTS